jgi:acyl-coenzyme A thioesterase PaaI-like protein
MNHESYISQSIIAHRESSQPTSPVFLEGPYLVVGVQLHNQVRYVCYVCYVSMQRTLSIIGRVLHRFLTSLFLFLLSAGTTGISVQQWDSNQAVVHLKNRWHIQNHLKGVHATAMATLAESATGMVFGCHVPDSHLLLLKSMKVDFVKRAQGDLKAVAKLTEEQQEQIRTTDKGFVLVQVKVTDETGNEPIHCAMEWAWTTKKKKASGDDKSSSSGNEKEKGETATQVEQKERAA